ncbi:MAG: DUF434 domain-containing protein [Bacteroidota bacterium]
MARNRGKHPNDDKIFAEKWLPVFKEAIDDHCHLLTRGYASESALEFVGNRYKLNKRQRKAIYRISASQQDIDNRNSRLVSPKELSGNHLEIDGFNLLILLESALSGAYIFKGRDGTYRDISSVHGSYKRVIQTPDAIIMTGKFLESLSPKSVKWWFDSPVSNSGRLKTILYELAGEHGFKWDVELSFNPDKELIQTDHVVVSSDGWILNHDIEWLNLGGLLIEGQIPDANIIDV